MAINTGLSSLLSALVEQHIAFAAWFNPMDNRLGLVAGDASDVKVLERFDQLNGEAGFVFAPYRISPSNPVILLKPRIYICNLKDPGQVDFKKLIPFPADQKPSGHGAVRDREAYLETIDETVNAVRNSDLLKVIISRQIPVPRSDRPIGDIFLQLQDKTPNAFTYLVNLPVAGTWMGATPEVLLKTHGNLYETVSLAGTQVRKYDAEDYFWSTKDIEEQAFISRYMLELFYCFDIHKYKTTGPETMESGKVAHLKTSFFFPAEKIDHCLGNFVSELHPTPAVCGLPKTLADEYIQNHENYDRRYYTGYLGPWKLDQQVDLFVNLRCMEVTGEEFILYAGGGITARSVPEKEWEETNHKARTLLSVIQPEE